ncbi:secreted RxLR effector protein 161-like [Miscanthus floridulus]|uniref:secreted RxLR effector protein 161-like n=1 Tax=Miscanthus floridulus TaxID=154761 RepID=UPI0034575CD1
MKKEFDMSDLGILCFYLGIEVRQDASGIALRQTHYTKRILKLGGITGYNPAHTPIEEWLKLSRDSTAEEVDFTHYRWLIGSLSYLVHTRPDLAFVVRYVSRFMERPTMEHLQAIKVHPSLRGRAPSTTVFTMAGPPIQRASSATSDSDLVGDVDTSKSTTGTMFFLGGCLVSWQSLKQKVVALSSCEAEYIASTTAATQGTMAVKDAGRAPWQDCGCG